MGVSWVFEAEQSAQSLERLLEINGADNMGSFTVDVTPFVPPAQHQIEIPLNYVVHHSKYPQTTFSIAPTGNNFKKSPRAVCDRGFDLILNQMKNGISADTMGKIEISGIEYKIHDFRVRIGTATQVTTVKGVVVEVEYEPMNIAHICKDMISEFIDVVFQKYTDTVPECFNMVGDKAEIVTPSDTIWQYIQIASKLRKKT